jgi:hypothetical protein
LRQYASPAAAPPEPPIRHLFLRRSANGQLRLAVREAGIPQIHRQWSKNVGHDVDRDDVRRRSIETAGNILKEFWPDRERQIHRRKNEIHEDAISEVDELRHPKPSAVSTGNSQKTLMIGSLFSWRRKCLNEGDRPVHWQREIPSGVRSRAELSGIAK